MAEGNGVHTNGHDAQHPAPVGAAAVGATASATGPGIVKAPLKPTPFTKDDFVSGQEVRWCPGCGDYSILSMMQRTLSQFDIAPENHVFISGIGCSSRFPYYMNTYGFHTIHGRAPTIASGLKVANPDLTVWVITGDGDGLSIGGNHLIHALRRNIDLNIILVNNQIYGLTKGQYSPTSEVGKVTKSSPYGSIEQPINALCLAIASEATFIARTVDTDPKHMGMVFERALQHKGSSFVEVLQNCIIFNDKAHQPIVGRDTREDRMIYLEDGKPLTFGKQNEKAIRVKRLHTEAIDIKEAQEQHVELMIHNEADPDPTHAYLLTQMRYPEKPVPFGVFRCLTRPTYDEMLQAQVDQAKEKSAGDLKKLIYGSETWTVTDQKRQFKDADKENQALPHIPAVPTGEINPIRETYQKVMMTTPIQALLGKDSLLVCKHTDTVAHIINEFQTKNKNSIIVLKDEKIAGIVSYRDLLSKVAAQKRDIQKTKAEDIMTNNPEVVRPVDMVASVVNKMAMGGFRHVPVVEDGKPLGIVTIKDVLTYLDTRD